MKNLLHPEQDRYLATVLPKPSPNMIPISSRHGSSAIRMCCTDRLYFWLSSPDLGLS